MTGRGIGVAGALDHGIVATLANAAETTGYSTFWANDTPNGEGLAALAAAARQTSSIRLGVGVIPIDRVSPEQIARRIGELALPEDRLIVGIGSGGLTAGARDAVATAAESLRRLTSARVVVGALGPRMCEVAGRHADGVLLNWLIPSYLPTLAGQTRGAAEAASRPAPWIAAYVRVALDGPAQMRLEEEAARYAGYPQYAAHFDRMGVRAIDTCVAGDATAVQAGLTAFQADADEVVARAISAEESLNGYLKVLRAAAPAAKGGAA